MEKNNVEKLVELKQKKMMELERLEDRHNVRDANYDNKMAKLKNRKYQEKQNYETKHKNLERVIDKIKKQIVLEKAFVSGIDKD